MPAEGRTGGERLAVSTSSMSNSRSALTSGRAVKRSAKGRDVKNGEVYRKLPSGVGKRGSDWNMGAVTCTPWERHATRVQRRVVGDLWGATCLGPAHRGIPEGAFGEVCERRVFQLKICHEGIDVLVMVPASCGPCKQ